MSIYESFQVRYDNMGPYDSLEEECFWDMGDYCRCKQCRRRVYLEELCIDEDIDG